MRARPLSPHLSVYRFGYTMILSITHRITGVFLAVGLLVLVWWLMAISGGASVYALNSARLSHWLVKLLLLGWLAAFLYHLVNGLRHLCWDAGLGLEKHQARRSAVIVVVVVLLAFVLCAWCLFSGDGGVA